MLTESPDVNPLESKECGKLVTPRECAALKKVTVVPLAEPDIQKIRELEVELSVIREPYRGDKLPLASNWCADNCLQIAERYAERYPDHVLMIAGFAETYAHSGKPFVRHVWLSINGRYVDPTWELFVSPGAVQNGYWKAAEYSFSSQEFQEVYSYRGMKSTATWILKQVDDFAANHGVDDTCYE